MSEPVRYRIRPARPEAHLFEVICSVDDPDPGGQRFALPAWIPGSYLVREFARHVVSIRASSRGRALVIDKLDKHTWRCAPAAGPVTVTCMVYAWDLSVRGAHLDATHGFFNGTSVFLRAVEREDRACEVEIAPPVGARYRGWRVATTLPRTGARAWGFGAYRAADYDELIDHPVEMGEFSVVSFRAAGVPHDVAITGRHDTDGRRLARDLKRVCEAQIRLFHGSGGRTGKPPFDRYLFLVMAVGEGYGGLEHRASTALICSRNDLPLAGMGHGAAEAADEGYRTFLGLASHEYFHAWNVKRIKPAAFAPYDLERENYTRLLWLFEGFTSYYDDLMLVRAGLISEAQYLETLGRAITSHLRTPGRRVQSLADSSFDAWIKYYRQDENTPNAVVSYYLKGSLVALCLDLLIRERSRGRRSLDDVMRLLWRRHAANPGSGGLPEDGFVALAERATGVRLRSFIDAAVNGMGELPLSRLLATHGIAVDVGPADSPADRGGRVFARTVAARRARATLGVRGKAESGEYRITHVLEGSAALAAGLAAGDALIAIDGLRVPSGGIDAALARRRPGQTVELHVFRRDELHVLRVKLAAAPADTCALTVDARAAAPAARLRRRWLGAL